MNSFSHITVDSRDGNLVLLVTNTAEVKAIINILRALYGALSDAPQQFLAHLIGTGMPFPEIFSNFFVGISKERLEAFFDGKRRVIEISIPPYTAGAEFYRSVT